MKKTPIYFQEFKEFWMNCNGYIPVYVYADDDFEREGYVRFLMDMVVPDRLLDGKICVLPVTLTEEELPFFQEYLEMVGDYWKKAFTPTTVRLLDCTNKFKGPSDE